jgi:hypothetical protein
MGKFSRAVVATGLIVILAAACGSSSKPKTDSTKPLTKAEYIEQSDSICRTYNERINSVVGSAGSGLTLEDYKKIFNDKLIPLFRAEHDELRALRPPKEDAAVLDRALVRMASGINTIVGRVDSAESIEQLKAIKPTGIGDWRLAAGKYGMKVCGIKK